MLINNDILIFKDFVLNLLNNKATISSCNIKIQISIKFSKKFNLKRVLAANNFVILHWIDILIEVNLAKLFDKDFIFLSSRYSAITFNYHMVDAKINKIFVQNNLPSKTCRSTLTCLGLVLKIKYNNYFQISNYNLTVKCLEQN